MGLFLLFADSYSVGSQLSRICSNAWSACGSQRATSFLRQPSKHSILGSPVYGRWPSHRTSSSLLLRSRALTEHKLLALRGGEDAVLDGVCRLTIPGDVENMERALDYFEDKQVDPRRKFSSTN